MASGDHCGMRFSHTGWRESQDGRFCTDEGMRSCCEVLAALHVCVCPERARLAVQEARNGVWPAAGPIFSTVWGIAYGDVGGITEAPTSES